MSTHAHVARVARPVGWLWCTLLAVSAPSHADPHQGWCIGVGNKHSTAACAGSSSGAGQVVTVPLVNQPPEQPSVVTQPTPQVITLTAESAATVLEWQTPSGPVVAPPQSTTSLVPVLRPRPLRAPTPTLSPQPLVARPPVPLQAPGLPLQTPPQSQVLAVPQPQVVRPPAQLQAPEVPLQTPPQPQVVAVPQPQVLSSPAQLQAPALPLQTPPRPQVVAVPQPQVVSPPALLQPPVVPLQTPPQPQVVAVPQPQVVSPPAQLQAPALPLQTPPQPQVVAVPQPQVVSPPALLQAPALPLQTLPQPQVLAVPQPQVLSPPAQLQAPVVPLQTPPQPQVVAVPQPQVVRPPALLQAPALPLQTPPQPQVVVVPQPQVVSPPAQLQVPSLPLQTPPIPGGQPGWTTTQTPVQTLVQMPIQGVPGDVDTQVVQSGVLPDSQVGTGVRPPGHLATGVAGEAMQTPTAGKEPWVVHRPGRQPAHQLPTRLATPGGTQSPSSTQCLSSGMGWRRWVDSEGRAHWSGYHPPLRTTQLLVRDIPANHHAHADCLVVVVRRRAPS